VGAVFGGLEDFVERAAGFAAAFADAFFAGDLAIAAVFADLLAAVFLGRAGAIRSTPSGYQMYQMRVREQQVLILRSWWWAGRSSGRLAHHS
jgi:hypothetical protein